MKTSQFVAMLLAIVIACTAIGVAVSTRESVDKDSIEFQTVDYTVPEKPRITSVNMLAVGDNLIHKPIYEQAQARTADGSYDFMPI